MATNLQIRMPDRFHPHTIEIEVGTSGPDLFSLSNWKIRCVQMKSGAGRGASPTWYPFRSGDLPLALSIAAAPGMRAALEEICELTFHDAVNGREPDPVTLTREQVGKIYELARMALLPVEEGYPASAAASGDADANRPV